MRTCCTGSFSSSSAMPTTCQYRRKKLPIGVPGPTRVSRSFCSFVVAMRSFCTHTKECPRTGVREASVMNARARALAIASVFLFTLGALRAQAQPAPFEINVMISMSGVAAFLGKEQVETYTILEKVVNRSGGIAARPVKFVFHDDQSSPQVGLQLVNEMISRKVPVIIGSSFAA